MPNPLEFILKSFSLYVISKNLEVIILGVIAIVFLFVVFKTVQNGFPQQGKDPERNKIVRLTLQGLFVMFFMMFFYLIFHKQVQQTLGAAIQLVEIACFCVLDAIRNRFVGLV